MLLDCRESALFLLVTPELVLGGQSIPLFSSPAEGGLKGHAEHLLLDEVTNQLLFGS